MPQERVEKGKRLRACSICGRAFKRTEHCIRHERAHFRERPFSCRFCDKSYGRKDLLVRHERTLHADQWALAQSATPSTSTSSQNRTNHRRQSRTSWDSTVALPTPVQAYKPEPHNGLFINNETVIQCESFLPSPRVSSSSEISDPEPASGASEAFELDRHIDPNLTNYGNIVAGGPNGDVSIQQFQPPFALDSQSFLYASQTPHIQSHDPMQFDYDHDFPLDPSLTIDLPKLGDPPTSSDSEHRSPNFFTLFPVSEADDQVQSPNQSLSLETFDEGPVKNTFALDTLLSEQRRRGRPARNPKTRNEPHLPKVMTDDIRTSLIADIRKRLPVESKGQDIPSLQDLHRYMNNFFRSFNDHLPLFHTPSFDISEAPSPLFLAMCSIGALLDKEKPTAQNLRQLAYEAIQTADCGSSARSLWEVQCRLLVIVGAAFGGDSSAVAWALENTGFCHREFASRRSALTVSRDVVPENWSMWIERESSKRLLFGIFVVNSLLTIIYNVSPGISTTEDLKIEMPERESIWMAADEEHWKEAMATRTKRPVDVNQALTTLLFGKDFNPDLELESSSFSDTILMHAVNVHMWHVTQSTQSFMNFSIDAKAEEQMKALCTTQVEDSLARCLKILARKHSAGSDSPRGSVKRTILFGNLAVLRSCYVRVFTGTGVFNRAMIFCDDKEEIRRAAREYVLIQQARTPFLAKAVSQVFDTLLTPMLQASDMLRKLDASTCSIEHAIATWDCALFHTKWVHMMETQQHFAPPDHQERKNLDNLAGLLHKVENLEHPPTSLAASAVRMWARFFSDNWTYEVIRRMGTVLEELACVYEGDIQPLCN